MLRLLTVVLAIASTLGSGYVHGILTGRWGTSGQLAAACERLQKVPATFGEWTSEPLEISARELEVGEIGGYVSRLYSHTDGRKVQMTLVCGPPGPISVHTPDVCFRGAGFRPVDQPNQKTIPVKQQDHELMLCDFVKYRDLASAGSRVFWCWSHDGTWHSPDNPRLSFAGQPFLYKLYVLRGINSPENPEDVDQDSCVEFIDLLIPELQQALFEKT